MDLSEIVKKYNESENETFANFADYYFKMNEKTNKNILSELHLTNKETNNILNKLKNYKYVEEVDDLKYGAFIRWIVLTDPDNLNLRQSCMICNVKFTDNGTIISCKNFMQKHYTIKMDECFIFQKISDEEKAMIEIIGKI
jgi:hypothetical protein